MLNKEKLLKISELKLSGKIYEMDEYILTLTEFIESFPAYETRLKEAFAAGDYDSFSKILILVRDLLIKIHADDLAQSCTKLLEGVTVSKQAYLNYFLTTVSSLSIDIQMAVYSADNESQAPDDGQPEARPEGAEIIKTILAVDDSPVMLNWIKSALDESGYKFTGLLSGAVALKFIKDHRPDLFILDIEMPEMDGYELARQIRENGHTAPIIFLTGNSSKEYVLKALQSGAADFIVKPINIENMLDKINKYIG